MPRGALPLIFGAAVLGWVAALIRDGGEPEPEPVTVTEPVTEPESESGSEPGSESGSERVTGSEPESESGSERVTGSEPVTGSGSESGSEPEPEPDDVLFPVGGEDPRLPSDIHTEAYRERLIERTTALRERNGRRLARAEARWDRETRDAAWAEPEELALQRSLVEDRLDAMLMAVDCRQTLCRMELSAVDSNAAFALKRAEAFAREAGKQVATTVAGGGLDRVLVLYIARDGTSLD